MDAAESFRATAEFADDARRNVRAWKWLLVAGHSSVQASLVIALSRGNFLRALKQTDAREWLQAHETGGPWPEKLQLDYFLELYAKVKRSILVPSAGGRFVCRQEHDDSMRKLNDFRN
ncbi:MAG: hypothetical protein ACM3QY_13250, partial [Candidatus Levyibacteriota bacterium]